MTTPPLSARLRGGGCGVLVGALAVAAHGIGGGGVPRSAEIALLLLVSLAAGMFAGGGATAGAPGSGVRAAAALIGGQWAGHFALSVTLDHHGGPFHLPGLPMIAAHLVAALACAALVLLAERLYLVASSVVRAVLTAPVSPTGSRGPRWLVVGTAPRGARPKGARCPRAPPLSA